MSVPAPENNAGKYPVVKPKRSKWKIAAVAVSAVVVLALVATGLYWANLRSTFNDNRTVVESAFPTARPQPSMKADYNGYTFLLIGSDTLVDADQNGEGDQRADTILLVNIPTDRSKVYVTSVLRDTYVPIPGYGEDKINAAMMHGGIPLLVETLETLTASRIDHVASVDFKGFESVTEAMGGVTVPNPNEFTAVDGDYYPATCELELEGEYALNWVRERKAFINSDYQRVENQQTFLKAVFEKMTSGDVLGNPIKLQDTVQSFSPYVTTNRELTAEASASIAFSLKNLNSEDIVGFTLNNNGTGETPFGESIVVADLEAFEAYGEAVNTDTMHLYENFALGTANAPEEEPTAPVEETVAPTEQATKDAPVKKEPTPETGC